MQLILLVMLYTVFVVLVFGYYTVWIISHNNGVLGIIVASYTSAINIDATISSESSCADKQISTKPIDLVLICFVCALL